jgi:hypothetical protein
LANLADELKAAMLERLRADQGFAVGVKNRIFESEPGDLLGAWIGATGFDAGGGVIDFVATVHVRVETGKEAAKVLIEIAKRTFAEAPTMDGISITGWQLGFHEARLEDENSAYHGLARFRAKAQIVSSLT